MSRDRRGLRPFPGPTQQTPPQPLCPYLQLCSHGAIPWTSSAGPEQSVEEEMGQRRGAQIPLLWLWLHFWSIHQCLGVLPPPPCHVLTCSHLGPALLAQNLLLSLKRWKAFKNPDGTKKGSTRNASQIRKNKPKTTFKDQFHPNYSRKPHPERSHVFLS